MDKFKGVFASRKFWATVIGLVFMFLKAVKPDFPLDEDQVAQIVYLLVAYVLGTAVEDGLGKRKAEG